MPVASVDNRGTGARGRDFKKQTYQRLGQLETADQLANDADVVGGDGSWILKLSAARGDGSALDHGDRRHVPPAAGGRPPQALKFFSS